MYMYLVTNNFTLNFIDPPNIILKVLIFLYYI